MTDTTTIDITKMTSEQAHTEVCEWLTHRLGPDELTRLARTGSDGYLDGYAEKLYSDNVSLPELAMLLDQMSGTECHGSTRRSVHRSAMRDTLRTVVREHQKAHPLAPSLMPAFSG